MHSVYWDGRIFRLAIAPPSPLPVEGVVGIVPCPIACMDDRAEIAEKL
jgi:hypothetical protein